MLLLIPKHGLTPLWQKLRSASMVINYTDKIAYITSVAGFKLSFMKTSKCPSWKIFPGFQKATSYKFDWKCKRKSSSQSSFACRTGHLTAHCLLSKTYLNPATFKPIVILGDLNCYVLSENTESKALASSMSDVNLSQVIATPERITDTSSSFIDVILVSNPNIISEILF